MNREKICCIDAMKYNASMREWKCVSCGAEIEPEYVKMWQVKTVSDGKRNTYGFKCRKAWSQGNCHIHEEWWRRSWGWWTGRMVLRYNRTTMVDSSYLNKRPWCPQHKETINIQGDGSDQALSTVLTYHILFLCIITVNLKNINSG